MNLLYPPEYNEFSALCKEYTVLDVLIKALEIDIQRIPQSGIKMARTIVTLFDEANEEASRQLVEVKRKLYDSGGEIISINQLSHARELTAKFRGFTYNHAYLNELIQAECERKLIELIKA